MPIYFKKWVVKMYDKKACTKYNAKRKKIACSVSNERYEEIKAHAEQKGFSSMNSYVLDLINKDMGKK